MQWVNSIIYLLYFYLVKIFHCLKQNKKKEMIAHTIQLGIFLEQITTTNIIASRIALLPSTICNNVVDYLYHM